MSHRMTSWSVRLLGLLACLCVASALLGATAARAAAATDARPCVVIDTDYSSDDMMAIPVVLANRRVAAIITTEGATRPGRAATALSRLFAAPAADGFGTPVLVGLRYPGQRDLTSYGWLPPIRLLMEQSNGFFSDPLDPAPSAFRGPLERRVVRAVAGCPSVSLLVTGPFTSFVRYSPLIRDRIDRVVMQGKPLRGDPTQTPGKLSFNCEYDLAACRLAFRQLSSLHATWVDVIRHTVPAYSPSLAMVTGLGTRGLPGALRAALLNHPQTWLPEALAPGASSYLWDQSAALYLLEPQLFATVGAHKEAAVSAARLQALWTTKINNALPPAARPA